MYCSRSGTERIGSIFPFNISFLSKLTQSWSMFRYQGHGVAMPLIPNKQDIPRLFEKITNRVINISRLNGEFSLKFNAMQEKRLSTGTIVFSIVIVGILLIVAATFLLMPQDETFIANSESDPVLETAVSPNPTSQIETTQSPTPQPPSPPTQVAQPATLTPQVEVSPPPTATNPPPATASPIPPTPTHAPVPINDLPVDTFVILPPDVQENIRLIYANGQTWGRNPNAYSILGDSTVLNPQLLARFDKEDLNLGEYSYLQPTVDTFANNWTRYGVAARNGLHSWSVFDPLWANKNWCEPEEDLLTCELRLQNPSYLIIRLGSNDAGAPSGFAYNMRQMVELTISSGVIPIIMTKADRFEGDNTNNEIMREIAADYKIPIWDFDVLADTLPERGLDEDQIHTKEYLSNDFTLPETFQSGHAMQDLSGLMMLDALLKTVQSGE